MACEFIPKWRIAPCTCASQIITRCGREVAENIQLNSMQISKHNRHSLAYNSFEMNRIFHPISFFCVSSFVCTKQREFEWHFFSVPKCFYKTVWTSNVFRTHSVIPCEFQTIYSFFRNVFLSVIISIPIKLNLRIR